MKSLCIKTNNSDWLQYLLNELEHFELEQICFSLRQFKHYKNIILHYTGKDEDLFFNKISSILSLFVIDELEEDFLKNLLFQNYFYFDYNERSQILNFCFDIMAENFSSLFDQKFKAIYHSFYSYITHNRTLLLKGFTTFRLQSYFSILEDVLTEAVNTFILEKEYKEFISLLKLYINSQHSNCETVHLIYSKNDSVLLNENKEMLETSCDNLKTKYLSDITFSANDHTLNSLLTLLPRKIYIHLVDSYIDDFINTLQIIFENRVCLCTDCNICELYRSSEKKKNPKTI